MSQVDPNWFYSASAQSAAAIVGLMGAFLTTKVLNQKLYIKQLKNEIDELNKKYTFLVEERDLQTVRQNNRSNFLSEKEITFCKKLDDEFNLFAPPSNKLLQQLNQANLDYTKQIRTKLAKYWEYENEITTKEGEILFLENVLKYKEEQLSSNKDINDSKKHLVNLAIFSVFGIFLPLFMMLLDFELMMEYRFLVLCAIGLGWLLIIITLGYEISNLKV